MIWLLMACGSPSPVHTASPVDTAVDTPSTQGLSDAISGDCGVISPEVLNQDSPSFFVAHLNLSGPVNDSALSPGGQTLAHTDNLGGDSIYSEVFAFEMLALCDAASLLKTEGQINYTGAGKRTDILVSLHDQRVGVSVVRAVQWPEGSEYTVSTATEHLTGKLLDIQESTRLAGPDDAWKKQILSVIAWDQVAADAVEAAWTALPSEIKGDTVIALTVTDGDDRFLYFSD